MTTRPNILIAEDNEMSRALMGAILQKQDYNIIPASDGDSAIDAVHAHYIDLALVDLKMEPKGGFEFIRYLVSHAIDLPIIVITADQSSDILLCASQLGVRRVLQKPVEPQRLIMAVERILARDVRSSNKHNPVNLRNQD